MRVGVAADLQKEVVQLAIRIAECEGKFGADFDSAAGEPGTTDFNETGLWGDSPGTVILQALGDQVSSWEMSEVAGRRGAGGGGKAGRHKTEGRDSLMNFQLSTLNRVLNTVNGATEAWIPTGCCDGLSRPLTHFVHRCAVSCRRSVSASLRLRAWGVLWVLPLGFVALPLPL